MASERRLAGPVLAGAAAAIALAGLAAWTYRRAADIETRFPPVGRFVADGDGTCLHFAEIGDPDGVPVLYLHGASGSLQDAFVALGGRDLRGIRLISVDRPGAGWSGRGRDPSIARPDRQADRVVKVLDALGLTDAVVVGHSLGAATALQVALRHADRTRGLVLLAPASHPWPGGIRWYYRLASLPVVGWLFSRTLVLPVAERILPDAIAGTFTPQAPVDAYGHRAAVPLTLRPEAFRATSQDLAALKRFLRSVRHLYRRIRVPTTIITGDRDATVAPSLHAEALSREIPGARLVWLPGVGHMPHHASPGRVVDEILRLARR